MADRYWVAAGSASWNAIAGTKWAATSGGVGGESVPTSADDVFFDASSPVNTATINATANCKSLNMTGWTGTLAGTSQLNVFGSLTLGSGINLTYSGVMNFSSTTTGQTITTNGIVLPGPIIFNGVGGEWTLQDTITLTGSITVTNGSFVANGQSISCSFFSSSNTNVRSVSLGASTITLTGTGTVWIMTITNNLTFSAGTSTILLTDTSASAKQFNGGGQTFNIVRFTGTGTGSYTITGSNTFATFSDQNSVAHTVIFTAGTTQTISSAAGWDVVGGSGAVITMQSSSGGTAWNIVASSGTVSSDYLSLQDSAASGGADFYAGANSTNVSGNSGWVFTAPPSPTVARWNFATFS